jgi:hypothetical protein
VFAKARRGGGAAARLGHADKSLLDGSRWLFDWPLSILCLGVALTYAR